MSTVKRILAIIMIFVLASCGSSTPTAAPAPVPPTSAPPPPTATNIPSYVPYVSDEPYAYYDFNDSFENVTDPAAYGITSWMNTVQVNTTNYNMGHQSIEAGGTVGGDQSYALSFDFSIQKILGSSSYDFSNKVIVLSVFIPTDSPIGVIYFEADKGDKFVQIADAKKADKSIDYGWSPTLPKGQWVEAVIDLKQTSTTREWGYTRGPNGSLTQEEAWEVVTHCETFKILGLNDTSGTSAVPTYFLLDDLRWLDRDSINIDASAESLRKYAAQTHLYMGSFAEYGELLSVYDVKFSQVMAQEFDLLTIGSHFFQYAPADGVVDFSQTDPMIDFAIGNHLAVFSYMGLVHTQMPEWLKDKSFAELGPILTNYIDTIGQHYKGKIAIWNVFSEVLNDDGNGFRNRSPVHTFGDNMYSPWVDGSDTSLIKAAFRQARLSDPNAILVLNDYAVEVLGRQKSEFFYNFVKEMVEEGVPIDGVAFELHLEYPPAYSGITDRFDQPAFLAAYLADLDANVKRYNDLGLKVVFSEVEGLIFVNDINTSTAAGQAELKRRIDYQAQVYGGLLKVALDNPNVIAFNVWGFTDRYSWIYAPAPWGLPGYCCPEIFDQDYLPKPAYDEVLKLLKAP